jgi:hypothetical protein
MRAKILGALAGVCGFAAAGLGQQPTMPGAPPGPGYAVPGYPTLNPANVMPNIYNPRTQPLSPYLNLLRGGNPGVNYYYGVRPGTVGGGAAFGAASAVAPGGMRAAFPFQYSPEDLTLPEPGEGYTLPPAGHPVVFMNTLGYFPGPTAGRGPQPGLAGAAPTANRPAAPRR